MKPHYVYLAGPVTGLDYNAARLGWRLEVSNALANMAAVACLSPFRHKDYLKGVVTFSPFGESSDHVRSTARGITTQCRFDAHRSDVVLANLLGANRISIGTVIEMAWADSAGIPIVCCIEDEGNLHDHAMVNEITGFRCRTLDEGIEAVRAILTPGL